MMGKWMGLDIIRKLAIIAGIGLLIFGVSLVAGFSLSQTFLPDSQVMAANQIFAPPTYNWYVCEDLGLGTIPGIPELRQILRLCHNQGWEIRAYCLQPGLAVPPIGSTCSLTPEDTYWCGDSYQLLRELALDVTPTASPIPLETSTSTPIQTQTPSPAATLTPSLTASQTPTGTLTPPPTEIPSDTPPPTNTPILTRAPTQTASATNTPVPSTTSTVEASQTPFATVTDSALPSQTPPVGTSETPQASSTSTPQNPTETPSPTWTVIATQRSETPTSTPVLPLFTPLPTPRPRPGGGGNLGQIGLMGIVLGGSAFSIGFLALLILRKNRIALQVSLGSEKSVRMTAQRTIYIKKEILILILLGLILITVYLLFAGVPWALLGLPQQNNMVMHPLEVRRMMTSTPFQPNHPTPVYESEMESDSPAPFDFQEIDFSPQSGKRSISIDPPDQEVNQGEPITISFFPAETCEFGDQQACVSAHTTLFGNILFLSIHSGYGGEGQAFRHAVEGTGINRAALSLNEVQTNLASLQDAEVVIAEDGNQQGGFVVKGVIRIPAAQLGEYFDLPIKEALELAGSLEPEIWHRLDRRQPILAFETCGWKMPGEPGSDNVANTTGSVYVVLIQPFSE